MRRELFAAIYVIALILLAMYYLDSWGKK